MLEILPATIASTEYRVEIVTQLHDRQQDVRPQLQHYQQDVRPGEPQHGPGEGAVAPTGKQEKSNETFMKLLSGDE